MNGARAAVRRGIYPAHDAVPPRGGQIKMQRQQGNWIWEHNARHSVRGSDGSERRTGGGETVGRKDGDGNGNGGAGRASGNGATTAKAAAAKVMQARSVA